MQVINQKNYFSHLEEINKNIFVYKRFLPKIQEYLKKDFPKTYFETLRINFPNIYNHFIDNKDVVKRHMFKKENVENHFKSRGNRGNKTINFVKVKYPSKTLAESFYRAAYDIKKIPLCLNCNNKTSFDSKNSEYHYFCCLKCKLKFGSIIQIINGKRYSFNEYSLAVRKLTEERCINVNNINLRGNNYHLDHKVSIYQAFKDKLDIDIVASFHNLEIISANNNLAKGIRCSISSNELIKFCSSSTT